MASVARLLPRLWDGRRLLQFLTGLALIALAFALPALSQPASQPAESPITIMTTVDTPLSPGLPVTEPAPRAGNGQPGLAMAPDAVVTDPAGATAAEAGSADRAANGTDPSGATAAEVGSADRAAGAAASGGSQGPADLTVQAGNAEPGICVEARTAVSGVTQRAHGERGPPRA